MVLEFPACMVWPSRLCQGRQENEPIGYQPMGVSPRCKGRAEGTTKRSIPPSSADSPQKDFHAISDAGHAFEGRAMAHAFRSKCSQRPCKGTLDLLRQQPIYGGVRSGNRRSQNGVI